MRFLLTIPAPSVEILYVKAFTSPRGPERGIRSIFTKARASGPCLLIFEDIDSLVTDSLRSYFLNEIDGLESNHGIMMVGSTNHLDKLDAGIAKRPSRFDRKYLFDMPDRDGRVKYAAYWRKKLESNRMVVFRESLCARIADATEGFSFAYMKEAFVAALLVIVVKKDKESASVIATNEASDDTLWVELERQLHILSQDMASKGTYDSAAKMEIKPEHGITITRRDRL